MYFQHFIVIFWPMEPTFGAKLSIFINFTHIWAHLHEKRKFFIFCGFLGFKGGGLRLKNIFQIKNILIETP